MNVVDRAKAILSQPKTEWPKIAAEPATIGSLLTGYAAKLALLPLLGTLIAAVLAIGPYRYNGLGYGISVAIAGYVLTLVVAVAMAYIVKAIAGGFDGKGDEVAGMKLVVYSATAVWVAAFFAFIPFLTFLISLAGFAYAAYLINLGAGPVMNVPAAKQVAFTIVVILVWIVLGLVVGGLVIASITASFAGATIGGAAMGF